MNRSYTYDAELQRYLAEMAVEWQILDQHLHWEHEQRWRAVYGRALLKRPRMRLGAKAEHAYRQAEADHYLIIPFSSNVDGIAMDVRTRSLSAYECHGPLAPFGAFANAEFFISPLELEWTMVHTHEDHALGGPYFMRLEWIA